MRELPDKPGCYIMRDRTGRIVYVGKASSLRKRVGWYFRAASLRSAPPKLRGLIRGVADLETIATRTEAEAVLLEGQLIKDYRPRYNTSFKDDKRFLLLRMDPREPLPRFKTCRIQRNDQALYFGPYASSSAARVALDFIEKRFGLRKCRPQTPDSETHQHCIDDIVRHCSAPCIGKVTRDEYRAHVEEACSFLRGEHPESLKAVETAMRQAAEAQDYERAAALRDLLDLLRTALKQRTRIAKTPEMKTEEARAGCEELRTILDLARIPRVIEAYDVSNISGTHAVASMVCAVDGMPHRNRYRHFRIKTVEGSDDPAMMAEVIRRRFARLIHETQLCRPPPPESSAQAKPGPDTSGPAPHALPDLVLVDGGITQVRAARAELAKLGLAHLAVAGLAKEHEEIHQDTGKGSRPRVTRLELNSRALRVLTTIRDEAHRFALTYHRNLRQKRIRESVLDDIPGLGKKRKELLLKHFGSLQRLKRATVEEIGAVPGFGKRSADLVRQALACRKCAPAPSACSPPPALL